MIKFLKQNISIIYIAVVYLLILLQYPAGMAISRLVLHQNLTTSLQPSYLLLWGLVRVLIVIPLLFTLIGREKVDHEKLYLSFGKFGQVVTITFWGTFVITILGALLYPWFLHTTDLTILRFVEYSPFFLLYAISNAFIEETFFRGISLHFIEDRAGFWIANIAQASFFSLIHFLIPMAKAPLVFVAVTFLLGIIWGYTTKRTRSLVPAIIMHVIADIFVAISLF